MSDFSGKTVTYAKLHTHLFVPGVGNLTDTLESNNPAISKSVVMVLADNFIVAKFKDAVGKPIVSLIPLTSVANMVLAKE
jgi:hypothetical protein